MIYFAENTKKCKTSIVVFKYEIGSNKITTVSAFFDICKIATAQSWNDDRGENILPKNTVLVEM